MSPRLACALVSPGDLLATGISVHEPGGDEIVFLGISPSSPATPSAFPVSLPELLKHAVGGILVAPPDEYVVSLDALRRANRAGAVADLMIFVPRREAPKYWARDDGPVRSVFCTAQLLRRALFGLHRLTAEGVAYAVVSQALAPPMSTRSILVHQTPWRRPPSTSRSLPRHVVLIPHRGSALFLEACLHFLRNARLTDSLIKVAIDQPVTSHLKSIVRDNSDVSFYEAVPYRSGPYALLSTLAKRTHVKVLVFQDSDDVPAVNRLPCLLSSMLQRRLNYVGSHELRLDEPERRLYAIRFPVDVNAALADDARHALLHPTAAIERASYSMAGGFNSVHRFGHDTQFLWRASFTMRIGNVDEFLYIRRRRLRSLSTSLTTGLGSFKRRRLLDTWQTDFLAVKQGTMSLASSSLATSNGRVVALRRLGPSPERDLRQIAIPERLKAPETGWRVRR